MRSTQRVSQYPPAAGPALSQDNSGLSLRKDEDMAKMRSNGIRWMLLTAASGLVALVIALGATASLSAQSSEVSVELRVAARVTAERIEFALRDADGEFWPPTARYLNVEFLAEDAGEWLRSSAVEIGAVTARVNAMPRDDGGVEFAVEVDGERHEPARNILTAGNIEDAANRWLVSTPVTITLRVDDRAMEQLEASGGTRLSESQCRAIFNREALMSQTTGVRFLSVQEFSATYLEFLTDRFETDIDIKNVFVLARRALDRYDEYLTKCGDVTIDIRADAHALSRLRQKVADNRSVADDILRTEERCILLQNDETITFPIRVAYVYSGGRDSLYSIFQRGTESTSFTYPVLSFELMQDLFWVPWRNANNNESSTALEFLTNDWERIARYVAEKAQRFITLCDTALDLSSAGLFDKSYRDYWSSIVSKLSE